MSAEFKPMVALRVYVLSAITGSIRGIIAMA